MAFIAPLADRDQAGFIAPEADRDPVGFIAPEADRDPVGFVAPEADRDREDPGLGDQVTALAADIAISEGGRLGATAAGTALLPGVGTAVGWVVGGLGAGAMGSYTRQKMLGDDVNYGEVVADAFLNIIPVPKAFKVFKNKAINQAVFQGGVGAGMSTGGKVIETSINEGRLPTLEEIESAGIRGATLGAGLGAAGAGLEKAYRKFAGIGRNDFNDALKLGDPDARILVDGVMKNAKQHGDDIKNQYSDIRMNLKESFVDEKARLFELQKTAAGGQLKYKRGVLNVEGDDMDFNLNSRLAEARIDGRNSEIDEIINLDSKFLVAKAEEMGVPASQLSDSINKYLYAKHALSFNKSKAKGYMGEGGASGISDIDASNIINSFERSGMNSSLKNVIDSRKDLSRQILDTLHEGGIVSTERMRQLRKTYPDYVPLNRIMDEDGKFAPLKYAAGGSSRSVDDIGKNIIGNLSSAIRMAETNKANVSFMNLIQSDKNKQAAAGIAQVYKTKDLKGQDLDKDTVVKVFKNGEQYSIKFADPRLAQAMKGMNRETLGTAMQVAMGYNRFIGSMYTRFNPEFMIPNLFRDRSEAIVNAAGKMGAMNAIKTLNPIGDMRIIRRNIFGKGDISSNPKHAQQDALYKQFVKDGGSTGNLGASMIKSIEETISDLQKKMDSPTSSIARDGIALIDKINSLVEDSTRFSVYRNGIDSGMTRKQAALAARDSSFDPLMKGASGDKLRALYLFANPAVQGSRNFLRTVTRNKKVAALAMTSLGGISLTLDLYNQSIDPEWREKLQAADGSSWKTDKSFTIVTGVNDDGTINAFHLPIGYSIAPFKKVADYTQKKVIQQGLMGIEPSPSEMDRTPTQDALELGKSFIDGYNPMGGSLWPTIARPWTELASNKDGLGRDIKPEWLLTKNISEVEKVYPWTMDTRGGEMAISFAEQLDNMGYEVSPENLKYLYQTLVGGPGKTVEKLLNVTSKMYNKEPWKASELPIVRRFFGPSSKGAFEARNYDAEFIDNLDKVYSTNQQKASRISSSTFKEMDSASSPDERRLILTDVLRSNPELSDQIFKSISTKIENKAAGLTSADQKIKRLSVAARAEFFLDRIDKMPPDQLREYLIVQEKRGVLTPSVLETMQEFKNFKDSFK
jgi:hypothetical protein